jgi:hypothetical protein
MASMQLPQWVARFDRHVMDPVRRLWAGWESATGILEDVARKSGKTVGIEQPRVVSKAEAAGHVTGFRSVG